MIDEVKAYIEAFSKDQEQIAQYAHKLLIKVLQLEQKEMAQDSLSLIDSMYSSSIEEI